MFLLEAYELSPSPIVKGFFVERFNVLIENTLFGIDNKVEKAIETLKYFEPREGFYVAFSGGKDSIVIKDLCKIANVKYDVHYQNTTIDPPEVVSFIRKYHPNVRMHYPPRPYFKELVKRGFPMRQNRWCCEFLKEYGGKNRIVITGIRSQESVRRRQRRMFESCTKKYMRKQYLNIILAWTEKEVWEYIRKYKLPYCKLYDIGFKRIGCIGCPLIYWKTRLGELGRYPSILNAYMKAFAKLYNKNKDRDSYQRWSSYEEMFLWWIKTKKQDEDMPLFA